MVSIAGIWVVDISTNHTFVSFHFSNFSLYPLIFKDFHDKKLLKKFLQIALG